MILPFKFKLLIGFAAFAALAGSIAGAACSSGRNESSESSVKQINNPQNVGVEAKAKADSRQQIGESAYISLPSSAKPWLDELNKLSIEPGTVFSLNAWSKAVSQEKKLPISGAGDGGVLDKIGSLLLQPAVQAGLKVGGRFRHEKLPEGISPGYDVDFEPDSRDLLLQNPYPFAVDVRVEAASAGGRCRLFASVPDNWSPETIAVSEETLPPGKRFVEDHAEHARPASRKGSSGRFITVSVVHADGSSEVLYKDYYAPEPEVNYILPKSEQGAANGAAKDAAGGAAKDAAEGAENAAG